MNPVFSLEHTAAFWTSVELQWFLHHCVYIWPEPSCRITSCLSGLVGDLCSQALCDKKAHMLPKPLAPTMGITSISEHVLLMSLNVAIGFIWAVSVHQSGTTWESDHSCALQFGFITHWSHMYGCPSCLPQQLRTISRVCLNISLSALLFLPRETFGNFSSPLLVFQLRVLILLWGDYILIEFKACCRGGDFMHDTIIMAKSLAEEVLNGHVVEYSKYLRLYV